MSRIGQLLGGALVALGVFFGPVTGVTAAGVSAVQVLEGVVDAADLAGYRLSGLKRGDRIAAHLQGTSGNLNPVLGLAAVPFDASAFRRQLKEATDRAAAEGRDLREALAKVVAPVFLTWNADDATSYDAVLNTEILGDGDYLIVVAGAPVPASAGSSGAEATFGRFRLVLALNPETPPAQDTAAAGEAFARFDPDVSPPESRVQLVTGELNAARPRAVLTLNPFDIGDELTARIHGSGGKPAPSLQLLDFGQKVLAHSTASADGQSAILRYRFRAPAQDYRLRLISDAQSAGGYRLRLGSNAAEVVAGGESAERGSPVARLPTPVTISIQLDQISSIVQREGKFGVVATLRLQWRDPGYAFSPASCHCNIRTFDEVTFRHFLEEHHLRWPEFVIFNLQGRRWNQGVLITVDSNGTARYMERFSASLQAPDLDFLQFPFDSQNFYIHIDSIFASERYKFVQVPSKNTIGKQVGLDEWMVSKYDTSVGLTDDLKSRFTFHVEAKRHLKYYVLKIFMPLMIILMTSWATFLLKDYNKRIDVTGAHLLLFVAFNFTISNDLPRLGYVTFMDTILASAFVVGSLLIMLNVYLKREETAGRLAEIRRVDRALLALYPVGYFLPWLVAMISFGIIP
ncbi:MAG: hypothetical protein WCO00_08135 [Rhodospirillaceae bacterium]